MVRRYRILSATLVAATLFMGWLPSSYRLYEFLDLGPTVSCCPSVSAKKVVVRPDEDYFQALYSPDEYKTIQITDNGLVITPYLANRVGHGNILCILLDVTNNSSAEYSVVKDSVMLIRREKDFQDYVETCGKSAESTARADRPYNVFVEKNYQQTLSESPALGKRASLHFVFDYVKRIGAGGLVFGVINNDTGKTSTYVLKMTDSGRRSLME